MQLSMVQVDAFTQRPLQGNPCAVVFDAEGLSPETMQRIAREINLSETAFVLPANDADFRARYFTPAEEIPFAGHPTVATTFAMLDSNRLPVPETSGVFTLRLEAGVIEIQVTTDQPENPRITMVQPAPEFLRTYDPADVLPAFGLEVEAGLPQAPVMTVSTGTPMLMIPLRDLDSLKKAALDIEKYRRLKEAGDFFSPHLFVLRGITSEGTTFARHFGVPPDTPEDPFTGSATGCMAAYLWRHGLIEEPRFLAQQGHWMERPGEAFVEILGSRDAIEGIKVGGYAAKVMDGKIYIP